MPESPVDRDQTDPIRPAAPRRDVPDWEYRTAYINYFQVRLPVELYGRLRGWAERDRKPAMDLLIDILEEAVRRRDTGSGAELPRGEEATPGRGRTDAQSPDRVSRSRWTRNVARS